MLRTIRFRFDEEPFTELALAIRDEVFVDELNVDPQLEHDEFEASSQHYLIYVHDVPVGTGRWRETGEGIKLERLAVLKQYRNSGTGSKLLSTILNDVKEMNKKIYLHSQINAIKLYLKFGFKIVGEKFIEAGLEHYKMVFKVD